MGYSVHPLELIVGDLSSSSLADTSRVPQFVHFTADFRRRDSQQLVLLQGAIALPPRSVRPGPCSAQGQGHHDAQFVRREPRLGETVLADPHARWGTIGDGAVGIRVRSCDREAAGLLHVFSVRVASEQELPFLASAIFSKSQGIATLLGGTFNVPDEVLRRWAGRNDFHLLIDRVAPMNPVLLARTYQDQEMRVHDFQRVIPAAGTCNGCDTLRAEVNFQTYCNDVPRAVPAMPL